MTTSTYVTRGLLLATTCFSPVPLLPHSWTVRLPLFSHPGLAQAFLPRPEALIRF